MSTIDYDKLEAAYEAATWGSIEPQYAFDTYDPIQGQLLFVGTITIPAPKYYAQLKNITAEGVSNLWEEPEEKIDPNMPDGYW